MRRVLGNLVIVSLLIGAGGFPADAQSKAKRRAEQHYNAPVVGTTSSPYYACFAEERVGCLDFKWRRGEKTVSFGIHDTSGLPVYAAVGQWTQGAQNDYITEKDTVYFCGKTTRPYRINPRKGLLTVFIWDASGPVPDCPGVGTAGDVVASFRP